MTILIIAGGVFAIFCAYMDYDWFMKNSRAAFFVALFGRGGARVFYIILGIVIIILGLMT